MMKYLWYAFTFPLLFISIASAQVTDTVTANTRWEFGGELNAYFQEEDITFLPVFRADKDGLHLEARYNYEDDNTISVWGGYNISGGKKLEYIFVPMIGVIAGNSSGFAPGFEMTLTMHNFELYSETEYLIDPGDDENNFFYMWSDLAWSPLEWAWVGISGQRTRVYDTGLDVQRGLFAGGGKDWWEVNAYFYNPASDDFYFIASVAVGF